MFCTQCCAKLPDIAKFCAACGAPTAGGIPNASAGYSSHVVAVDEPLTPTHVVVMMADERERRDRIARQAEVGDYGKHGPVTEAVLQDGARLYEHFSELKPVVTPDLRDEHREYRDEFLEPLRFCRDTLMFLLIGRQMWVDGSDVKRRLRNDFKLFADDGIVALVKANKQHLRGLDAKFIDNLEKYGGVRQHLEEQFFGFLLTAARAYRAGIKKELVEQVAIRIGLKQATEIMEVVFSST